MGLKGDSSGPRDVEASRDDVAAVLEVVDVRVLKRACTDKVSVSDAVG